VIRELLEDPKYRPWLIVLDGADDKDIFLKEKDGLPALSDYIPRASHGRVLITTIDSQVAGLGDYFLVPIQNGIRIFPLSPAEGVDLLRKSVLVELHKELGIKDQSKCKRLVNLLDCLPIALHHTST
jgi:hypothetical protein